MEQNVYVLTPDGELYHWGIKKGEEKDDHKYIKREWKNGKWIYTYPSDAKGKQSASKNQQTKRSLVDSIKTWFESREKDWQDAKKRADKKAEDEAAVKGAKIKNTDEWLSSALTTFSGNKQTTTAIQRGKIDQYVDTAKEYLASKYGSDDNTKETNTRANNASGGKENFFGRKFSEIADEIGITARGEYKDAKGRYTEASKFRESRQSEHNVIRDDAYADATLTDKEKKQISESQSNLVRSIVSEEKALKALSEVEKDYLETPLGKAEAWLKDLFGFNREIDPKLAAEEKERQAKGKESERNANKLKDLLSKITEPLKGLKLKQVWNTKDEDMALVNPNYTRGGSYDENCAVCTLVYDLRRRGYDVEAMPEEVTTGNGTKGLSQEEIEKLYKDVPEENQIMMGGYESTFFDFVTGNNPLLKAYKDQNNISTSEMRDNLSELESELLKYGDGARGAFAVYWRPEGGHSMAWEVENGRVVIRDAQVNRTYTLEDFAEDIYFFDATRLDNVEPTEDILKYVKNRGE